MYYVFNLKGLKYVFITVLVLVIMFFSAKTILNIYCPVKYTQQIEKYSEKYGVDKNLVYAIINAESRFNPDAISHKGAVGLMQIMEETGLWAAEKANIPLTEDGLSDPDTNINIGVWYLKYLLDEFDGNIDLAVCAYNAGINNVKNWLKDEKYTSDGKSLHTIPYKETDNYLKKIRKYITIYKYITGDKK